MKRYLGDGVYADYDGYSIILTTENGVRVTNRIVLEPDVHSALEDYVEHLDELARQKQQQKKEQ